MVTKPVRLPLHYKVVKIRDSESVAKVQRVARNAVPVLSYRLLVSGRWMEFKFWLCLGAGGNSRQQRGQKFLRTLMGPKINGPNGPGL